MPPPDTLVNTLCLSGALLGLLWKYGQNSSNTQLLPLVQSTIDGRYYRVMQTANAVDAANQLCRVKQAIQRVLQLIKSAQPSPPEVQAGIARLLRKHPSADSINLCELHPNDASNTLAFNEGKGEFIFVCMRQRPGSELLGADDIVLYIVLHELAHSMIDGYAPTNSNGQTIHDATFRAHNEFLNRVAEQAGLLRPGKVPGRPHCGVYMPDPQESV